MDSIDAHRHRGACSPPPSGFNRNLANGRRSPQSPRRGSVEDSLAHRTLGRRRFLIQIGNPSDPKGLFVAMERYLEHLGVQGHTPMGIHNVERYLRAFMRWGEPLALVRPAQIAKTDIESYQRYLFHHRKANGEPLSVFSQRSALVPVRGFFRWLAREKDVPCDPAADVALPRVQHVLPHQILTAREAERVLRQPDTRRPQGVRDRAMLEVFYSTGLRRMELAGLRVSDVDEERGMLFVSQGKWGKDRWVPISDRALAWVRRYREGARSATAPLGDNDTLFLTRNGKPFNESWLSTIISNHVGKARLGKSGSCHLFRHTMATLMLENGADIRFIQAMLGHADLKSTQIYTHVAIGQLKAIHAATHPGCRHADGERRPTTLSTRHHNGRSLKQYLRTLAEELPETATMEEVLRRLVLRG